MNLPVRTPADRDAVRAGATNVEDGLLLLARYGKPRLTHVGQGWYCAVDMHVSSTGCEFKVASEFNCPSPLAALLQCLSRLDAALRDIGA